MPNPTRTAVKFSAPTARKGKRLEELKPNLASLVDDPAQEHARVLLVKDRNGQDVAIAKAYVPDDDCLPVLTSAELGHQHLVMLAPGAMAGETSYAAAAGAGADGRGYVGHSHPWVLGDDGQPTIGEALGHTHELLMPAATEPEDAVAEAAAAVDAAAAQMREAVAAASSEAEVSASAEPVADTTDETATTKTITPAADGAQIDNPETLLYKDHKENTMPTPANATTTDETLRTELAKARAYGLLNDAEKAHAASLDGDARDAFISKGRNARAADMAAALEADPVLYKSARTGREYRRSGGADAAELAREVDELKSSETITKAKLAETELVKRAAQAIPLFKGTDAVKAAILRAVDGIADEELRKSAHETLAAANGMITLSKTHGGPGGEEPTEGSAGAELRKYVNAAAKDMKVSYSVALSKLTETDPHVRELAAAARQEEEIA